MAQDQSKKILVLGTSRGGTTLVSSALGAHPNIAMLDEDLSGAICKITGGKIAANKLCVPNQIDFERKWNKLYTIGLANGFFRKTLFMNKIPKGIYNIQNYNSFGNMHFIGILRHPAGVLRSIQSRENKSLRVACYRWQRCLEVFEILAAKDDFNFTLISFENLVQNPVNSFEKICVRLNIEYSDSVMQGPKSNKRYSYDKGFDQSKTQYEDSDQIWENFETGLKERYEKILKTCLQ